MQVHILFIPYFAMIQIMAKKSSIVPCKDLMFIFVRIFFLTPVKEEAIIIFQQVGEINFFIDWNLKCLVDVIHTRLIECKALID